jgi:hypothetical protein
MLVKPHCIIPVTKSAGSSPGGAPAALLRAFARWLGRQANRESAGCRHERLQLCVIDSIRARGDKSTKAVELFGLIGLDESRLVHKVGAFSADQLFVITYWPARSQPPAPHARRCAARAACWSCSYRVGQQHPLLVHRLHEQLVVHFSGRLARPEWSPTGTACSSIKSRQPTFVQEPTVLTALAIGCAVL